MRNNKYNRAANEASSIVFNAWKEGFEQGKLRVRVDTSYQLEDICFDIDANIVFKKGLSRLNIDGGAGYDADLEDEDFIQVRFEVDPKLIPDYWEEISMNLKDLFRHEIEHLIHGEGWNSLPSKMMEDDSAIRQMINTRLLPRAEYFKLDKEVDANLQGMYFRAKKEKVKFSKVVDNYLNSQKITVAEKKEILTLWRNRANQLGIKAII
jgi:hypothetical protein